jgi:hypothetical protein
MRFNPPFSLHPLLKSLHTYSPHQFRQILQFSGTDIINQILAGIGFVQGGTADLHPTLLKAVLANKSALKTLLLANPSLTIKRKLLIQHAFLIYRILLALIPHKKSTPTTAVRKRLNKSSKPKPSAKIRKTPPKPQPPQPPNPPQAQENSAPPTNVEAIDDLFQ